MMGKGRRTNRGDTIVEVLIATAIVSSVLAGAFTVTQRSTLAVRDSQERAEVLQILQGQVERVRSLAQGANATDPLFDTTPKYFCISPTLNVRKDFLSGGMTLDPDYGNFYPECKAIGAGGLYNIAVSYDDTDQIFTFLGKWDGPSGRTDTMQLSYRIYPGL